MPRHEYYLLGDTVPIRVSFNKYGHRNGAEIPDRASGELRQDPTYLGRIMVSLEAEEISENEWRQRCEDIWAHQAPIPLS
jgi:hypothetical protein